MDGEQVGPNTLYDSTKNAELYQPPPSVDATDEDPKEDAPEEDPKEDPKEEPKDDPKEKANEAMVPLAALHAERNKRRLAEQKLKEKPAEEDDPYTEETKTDSIPKSQYLEDKITQTNNRVRSQFRDADIAFKEFDDAVDADESIWTQYINSPDPGQFAYDFGKDRMFKKKYGSSHDEVVGNIKKELETEVEQKVMEKFKLTKKQPKGVRNARSSSAPADDRVDSPLSTRDLYDPKPRRK